MPYDEVISLLSSQYTNHFTRYDESAIIQFTSDKATMNEMSSEELERNLREGRTGVLIFDGEGSGND